MELTQISQHPNTSTPSAAADDEAAPLTENVTFTPSLFNIPREPDQRKKWRQDCIEAFKKWLNELQDFADQPTVPLEDMSKVHETSKEDLSALETEYNTLTKRVADLENGRCGRRAWQITSYFTYTFTALSALALLAMSVMSFSQPDSTFFVYAEIIAYTCMAGGTSVGAFCKKKRMNIEAARTQLDSQVKEQLNQARIFNTFVDTIVRYQTIIDKYQSREDTTLIPTKDSDRMVKILKKSVESFVQLSDDSEELDADFSREDPTGNPNSLRFKNVDEVTSTLFILLPRRHEARQVFDQECQRCKKQEVKRSYEKKNREECTSPSEGEAPPMSPPMKHKDSRLLLHQGEGAGPKFMPVTEEIDESSTPMVQEGVTKKTTDPLKQLGIDLKVIWIKRKPLFRDR